MSDIHKRQSTSNHITDDKEELIDLVWSTLLLVLIVFTTRFINQCAIPYINSVYKYTAEAIRIEYGVKGIMSALHNTSPTDWFQTKLYSLELPQYKWYIAILLAVMVQVITGDLELYLDMTWIKNKGEAASFIVDGVISFILTEFMFSLTLLSLLTVCPQHIKLLFMILEMAIFCFPALVHTFILRRGIFSKLDSISFALQVGLLFFTIEKSFLCGILLYIVKFITSKARDIWPDVRRLNFGRLNVLFDTVTLVITVILVVFFSTRIRPYIVKHDPIAVIERKVIHVTSIAVNKYRELFIREDQTAIDSQDKEYLENVIQIAPCSSNNFFLLNSGEVMVCSAPGYKPVLFMERCKWISSFKDVLIAIDAEGEMWGFGDLTRYVSGGGYTGEPTVIVSGLKLVKADVGKGHILMLDDQGNLYSMGQNTSGELGNGHKSLEVEGPTRILSEVVDAKAGCGVSYALSQDGIMYAWGRNDVGQLGTNVKVPKFKIGDGYGINSGDISFSEPTVLDFAQTPIRQIAIGAECGFAIDMEDQLWIWGKSISRESIALPQVYRNSIMWVADNKYQAGERNQNFYYIDMNGNSYREQLDNIDLYDVDDSKLIFDTSNWFPEPIETTNSWIEEKLNSISIFDNDDDELMDSIEQITVINNPAKDISAHALHKFGGHTYQIIDEYMYTGNAESYCEGMEGHLLTITSREEHDFVNQLIQSAEGTDGRFFGIGLKYNGSLYWETGESTEYLSTLDITPANQDDNAEGYINSSGNMNVGMLVKHPFICEWDYD